MSRFSGDLANSLNKDAKTGILITNLGTPEQPTTASVRRYLKEFLSDPRVVEIPRLVWLIILHGIILRVRPSKSAKLYQSIWTEQGSPLLAITEQQKAKLIDVLTAQHGERFTNNVVVDIAMRYGNPSIENALNNFQRQGINNIVVMPLYPQYAGPTTGSTFDAIAKVLTKWRWVPSVHFISSYHDNALYIQALANSVSEFISANGKPDKLVLSYHGMPKLFHQAGDPYYDYCQRTTDLLVEQLGLAETDYIQTFQSRFGKAEWLQPYTDETLENLPKQGVKNIAIISPAFSADCLETLEELEGENREVFIEAGGEQYHYIPALNDRDDHIRAIADLIQPYMPR
ncbi:ferrochelatase [Thalassotalea sp. PLHSN55]|uniref:ferrochelatase n=1 Tax=Thalassotalea sp. PLHSN55 TaxID=3435888 RepID=UPI003F8272F5